MADLVFLQSSLVENTVATDPALWVYLPVLQQVRVPDELVATEKTDGMTLEMFHQPSLGTEAVTAEDTEERTVGLEGGLDPGDCASSFNWNGLIKA